MTHPEHTPGQPPLSELMARYLERQSEAHAAGLVAADAAGEVVPFEAAPVQAVDPRIAWEEAQACVRLFTAKTVAGKAPPDWPAVVAGQEPTVALAMAVGNFPQLVRHLQPLLQGGELSKLQPKPGRPIAVQALLKWVGQAADFPQALLALGALRLARQFDLADKMRAGLAAQVPADWQPAWANEEAALAWHRGQAEAAARMWQQQPESVPVLFNRGMAAIFLDRGADARASLKKAIARLPESSAWHHLGRLYLTLAER